MSVSVSVTKRERSRPVKGGGSILHTRYVVNFNDRKTGGRRQLFFARHRDALEKRDEIVGQVHTGAYASANSAVTVGDAVGSWLRNRTGEVKRRTLEGYADGARRIVGPLLHGTAQQRRDYALTKILPEGTELLPLL